ncbi:hypothetical protein B0H16DRAFT_1695819 [Mycena metata]|uniref:Uncharacterized protein n=1 Tax=Mycena metata TaxID=1033252 RepID=A0AAD7MVM0_9AGAR|nr:hypothetical protein B0H16DRAFT_1695819 [Mycena metata]
MSPVTIGVHWPSALPRVELRSQVFGPSSGSGSGSRHDPPHYSDVARERAMAPFFYTGTQIKICILLESPPMSADNTFRISEWIGKGEKWASAPSMLRKIAAAVFAVPQELELVLLPSPSLSIAKMLDFTLPLEHPDSKAPKPTQYFSSVAPDISDKDLLLRPSSGNAEASDAEDEESDLEVDLEPVALGRISKMYLSWQSWRQTHQRRQRARM